MERMSRFNPRWEQAIDNTGGLTPPRDRSKTSEFYNNGIGENWYGDPDEANLYQGHLEPSLNNFPYQPQATKGPFHQQSTNPYSPQRSLSEEKQLQNIRMDHYGTDRYVEGGQGWGSIGQSVVEPAPQPSQGNSGQIIGKILNAARNKRLY